MKTKNKHIYLWLMLLVTAFSSFFMNMEKAYAGGTDISKTTIDVKYEAGQITIKAVDAGTEDPVLRIMNKLRDGLVLFSSLATITFAFIFIMNLTKLAAAGDNPMGRKSAISGLIISFICFALLGGITIIIGFFQGFFSKI